jgi:hypothetical protein
MPEQLGVLVQTLQRSALLASEFPFVVVPVTIAAGEGALEAGTLIGRRHSDGKYRKYQASTAVTGESIGNTGGTPGTSYSLSTAQKPIVPGSLKVTVGTTVFYDRGDGTLDGGPSAWGNVYYNAGRVELRFASAPPASTAIVADYSYWPTNDGSQVPVAVLAVDVDATSEDRKAQAIVVGHVRGEALKPPLSAQELALLRRLLAGTALVIA